jgi:hypothetical protein
LLAVLDFFYLLLLVTAPLLSESEYEQNHQPVEQDHHYAEESETSLRLRLRIVPSDWLIPIDGRLLIHQLQLYIQLAKQPVLSVFIIIQRSQKQVFDSDSG